MVPLPLCSHTYSPLITVVQVGFQPITNSVREGHGFVALTIVKLTTTTQPVTVLLSTVAGTADGKLSKAKVFQWSK